MSNVPTAKIEDYRPPTDAELQLNEKTLQDGKYSGVMKGCRNYVKAHAVITVNLHINTQNGNAPLLTEIASRWRGDKFSLQASKEYTVDNLIPGGYREEGYRNVLHFNKAEQKRSILAIEEKTIPKFNKTCPLAFWLIEHIKKEIEEEVPDWKGQLHF